MEYFPHAVDFSHSLPPRGFHYSAAIERIPRPRLGYFGLVYEKIDFCCLERLPDRSRRLTSLLIGPVDYCPPEFSQLANVHLLGRKSYDDRPTGSRLSMSCCFRSA